MIGTGYLGLDINLSNMLLLAVSGCCPKYNWIERSLQFPNNMELGNIAIKTNRKLVAGAGTDLIEGIELPIYYCKGNNWVCIGEQVKENYDINIQFMKNAIMSLKNNEFKALWINPIYIN